MPTVSADGRYLAYALAAVQPAPAPPGALPAESVTAVAVTEVATSVTSPHQASDLPVWAGERVLVGGAGGPFAWDPKTGWRRVSAIPTGLMVSSGTGVLVVEGVPAVNGCLKWWVDPDTPARGIRCDRNYTTVVGASPDGRTALVSVLAPSEDTAVFAGIDAVDAVSYTHLDVYKRQVCGPCGRVELGHRGLLHRALRGDAAKP